MKRRQDFEERKSWVCSGTGQESRLRSRDRVEVGGWPEAAMGVAADLELFWLHCCGSNWEIQTTATHSTLTDGKRGFCVSVAEGSSERTQAWWLAVRVAIFSSGTSNLRMATAATGGVYVGDKHAPAFGDESVFQTGSLCIWFRVFKLWAQFVGQRHPCRHALSC